MKAFVLYLNGEPFVTAGIGDDGVLSTNVTWVGGAPPRPPRGKLSFRVGGLDSRTKEHVGWEVPEIGVGDEITIKIIETDQVTPEDFRYTTEELERQAAEEEASEDFDEYEDEEEV